jgi:iron complex transport system ATP-binding protein
MSDAFIPLALCARIVEARLGQSIVLQNLELQLPVGRWTSIVGPNGAGKSTLLKVLAGLLPFQGSLKLLGRPIQEIPGRQRARQLAWLGQGESVAEDLSVADLVLLGRLPHQSWLGSPSQADHAAVRQALMATQAWTWRHRSLAQLSGGERQRVLLARALAVQSQVLLMDEPLANLDPPHQADWLAVVRRLVGQGTTVVSVLHEISMALQAQDMVILKQGRVIHHGSCQDPKTHRALEAVFDARIGIHPLNGQWIAQPLIGGS